MASYTNPILHATGDDLDVTDYNAVANNTTFLYQTPYALIYQTNASSVPEATGTQVSLGGVSAMNYGWSVSSNNLVVPLTGIYNVIGTVTMQTSTGSPKCFAFIYHNGTETLQGSTGIFDSTVNTVTNANGLVSCTAGDTLGLWVYQTAAGPLATVTGSSNTYLHAFFVGSQ